jgi:hypothetical protein
MELQKSFPSSRFHYPSIHLNDFVQFFDGAGLAATFALENRSKRAFAQHAAQLNVFLGNVEALELKEKRSKEK